MAKGGSTGLGGGKHTFVHQWARTSARTDDSSLAWLSGS